MHDLTFQKPSRETLRSQLDARQLLTDRFALHKPTRSGPKLYGCCPFHDDKKPSLVADHEGYRCFGCGESGDAFDLVAKLYGLDTTLHFPAVLQHAAHMVGMSPTTLAPTLAAHRRDEQRLARENERRRVEHERFVARAIRRRVMKDLWSILEPLDLTGDARTWLQARGLDPDQAHAAGCRDWSAAREKLDTYFDTLSEEELVAAGLSSEGKGRWYPLRTWSRGLAVPCWAPDDEAPIAWRWRLYEPWKNGPKTLAQPSGTSAPGWRAATLFDVPENVSHLVIVEGEPDWLTAREHLVPRGIGVIGLCTVSAPKLDQILDQFEGIERITLAVHHDRNDQGEHKIEPHNHPVVASFATWSESRNVHAHILDIDGACDLNDLHRAGELDWFVRAVASDFATLSPDKNLTDALDKAPKPIQRTPEHRAPRLSLEKAEVTLQQALERATEEGGKWCVQVDCGTGKTHQSALIALQVWRDSMQGVRPQGNLAFVVKTNTLAHELEQKLRALAPDLLSARDAEAFEVELVIAPKRTRENCQSFDAITRAHRVSPTAASKVCKACPHRESCPFLEEVRRPRGRITIMTHELAVQTLSGRAYDLVVIDEDITDTLYPQHTIDLDALAILKERDSLAISDASWSHLSNLLASNQSHDRHTLHAAIPRDSIRVHHHDAIQQGLENALALNGQEQLDALDTLPNGHVLDALEACVDRQWAGCFVHRKTLSVQGERTLDLSNARTVLYLDATTSPLHARTILGDDVHHVRVRTALADSVTIERVHWDMSKSLVNREGFRYDVNRRRFQALAQTFESPDTAWVLHKAYRNAPDAHAILAQAEREGRVTHHGAARGSNRLEHCNTIVVAPYHVPNVVKEARADLLERFTGAHPDQCRLEAQAVIEQGAMIQAAHRIRPVRATEPTHIVLLDANHTLDGLETDTHTSIDVLRFETLGELSSEAWRKLIIDYIEANEALIPSGLSRCAKKGCGFAEYVLAKPHPFLAHDILSLKQAFEDGLRNGFDGSLKQLAEWCGLAISYVTSSYSGRSLAVLHPVGQIPSQQAVMRELEPFEVRWFEWQNHRVDVANVSSELVDVLRACEHIEDVNPESIAQLMGVSRRTYYNRMRDAGWSLEDLRERWRHLHEPPPPPEAAPETGQSPANKRSRPGRGETPNGSTRCKVVFDPCERSKVESQTQRLEIAITPVLDPPGEIEQVRF